MTLEEVRGYCRLFLQDSSGATEGTYFLNASLNSWINEGQRVWVRRSKCLRTHASLIVDATMTPATAFYTLPSTLHYLERLTCGGNTFSPAETALTFYTQFANPAKVTYTWNARSNNSIEAFAAGRVAMIFSYHYLRENLAGRAPFLNYAVAPAPQIDQGKNKSNFANYWAEAVSAQSKNQEAAWRFLKFISQKDVLKKYYAVKPRPSARIDLIEEQIADPEIGVFAENALSAKSFYKPDSRAVESIMAQMINDVVLRNVPPKEALSAASQKFSLLLRNL